MPKNTLRGGSGEHDVCPDVGSALPAPAVIDPLELVERGVRLPGELAGAAVQHVTTVGLIGDHEEAGEEAGAECGDLASFGAGEVSR